MLLLVSDVNSDPNISTCYPEFYSKADMCWRKMVNNTDCYFTDFFHIKLD